MLRITVGLLLMSVGGCRLSGGPAHFANPAKATPAAPVVTAPAATAPGLIPTVVAAQAAPAAGIVVASPNPPIPIPPAAANGAGIAMPPVAMTPPAFAAVPPTVPQPPAAIYTPIRSPENMNIAPGLTTQDVMLIPRMVYVPYAPQTPVNPARLSSLVPPGHPMAAADNANNDRMAAALERSTQMMEKMTLRIAQLEEIVRRQPQAPIAPPVPTPSTIVAPPLPVVSPPVVPAPMPKIVPPAPVVPQPTIVPPAPLPKILPAIDTSEPLEQPMTGSLPVPKPAIEVEMPPIPVSAKVRDAEWTPASANSDAPLDSPMLLLPPPNATGYDRTVEIEPTRLALPVVDSLPTGPKLPKFPSHFLKPFYPYAR